MKIFVCIKQVPDTETKIKLNADRTQIDENGIKWVMNPYDEFAVEEALKVKEAHAGSTVTVFSLGPKKRVVDSIRTALAMGADEGVVIDAADNLDSFATAKLLALAIQQEGTFDLLFTGKLAIDDNASAVSQMVAELVGIPHSSVVSKFKFEAGKVLVERDIEGGAREIVEMQTPALVAANKGLNMPRYASLPGIMKAKKKPLKELSADALGFSEADIKLKASDYQLPPEKPPVKMLSGDVDQQVQALVQALKNEAKVL